MVVILLQSEFLTQLELVIYMAIAFAMATTVIGGFISGVSFMVVIPFIFLWPES